MASPRPPHVGYVVGMSLATLHHLGPAGTFSEDAARAFGGDTRPQPTFDAVAAAVAAGEGDGVLPYYNLLEGLVQESIDAVFERGLRVVDAARLPITFALGRGGPPPGDGTDAPDGTEVISHPKALAQCSDHLDHHYPALRRRPAASTAEGAALAARSGQYAIAKPDALRDAGLRVIADDVGNRSGGGTGRANFTDFLRVSLAGDPSGGGDPRTLVAVSPRENRPGLLADVLREFAFYRLDLAKIHSRPALGVGGTGGGAEPQMFYMEVMAAHDADPLRRCLDALGWHLGDACVREVGGWSGLR